MDRLSKIRYFVIQSGNCYYPNTRIDDAADTLAGISLPHRYRQLAQESRAVRPTTSVIFDGRVAEPSAQVLRIAARHIQRKVLRLIETFDYHGNLREASARTLAWRE